MSIKLIKKLSRVFGYLFVSESEENFERIEAKFNELDNHNTYHETQQKLLMIHLKLSIPLLMV